MFKGSITALITPFDKNGDIDWKTFDRFVEWQVAEGSHGVVPCGTTGESPTLTHEEHRKLITRCVEIVAKRIPVMAGTGSNNTREAIDFTAHAKSAGADGALIVTPYYNKPTQDGLYAHYKTIADAVNIPIILYNIPGRSVIDMSIDTMCRLAEIKNIVGVKDATGDLTRPLNLRSRLGDSFIQLAGDDGTASAFLAQGGHGCISVASNIAPKACAQMQDAWASGDIKTMAVLRDRMAPLFKALFVETSPAPIKYAASRMGFGTDAVRLPLVPASASCRQGVDEAMNAAGVLAAKTKAA